MPVVIYRKSDLMCVGTVMEGMSVEQEIELNVIPNFGGNIEDYETIETDLLFFELQRVDGKIVVVEKEMTSHQEAPSEIEILGQQLVEKDLQILELQEENKRLGQLIVELDLRLLQGGL